MTKEKNNMEYMTVLKRPDVAAECRLEAGGLGYELHKTSLKSRRAGRRLCSQALFIVIMLILMLVMFTSQLIVHVQLQELRSQVKDNKQKVDDMLEAALIEKFVKEQRELGEKKDRRIGNRKRDNSPVYFNLRGGGSIGELGIFQWDHTESVVLQPRVVPVPSNRGDGSLEKIKVTVTGLYSVSVQINVKGRSHVGSVFGPVGYLICKETPDADNIYHEELLDKVFLTQDERGEIRLISGGRISDPPVDSLSYTNTLYLTSGDRIYVKRPDETRYDNTIRYDNSAASAHFTGHLIFN